jgi:hypothetical protein
MSENVKQSIRVLLADIIDYAGLFPPSKVSMSEAVINYATYKNSNFNWMLSRFVLPAARLDEFLESAEDFISRDPGGDVWRLSVLAGEDIYDTLRRIEDFNSRNSSRVVADVLEVRATTESNRLFRNSDRRASARSRFGTGDSRPARQDQDRRRDGRRVSENESDHSFYPHLSGRGRAF